MDKKMLTRRNLLAGSLTGIVATLGGTFFTGWNGKNWTASKDEHSQTTEGATVEVAPFTTGFGQPVALENPIDGVFYIAEKTGKIYVHADGELASEPVLDISDGIVLDHGEQGLLGIECHPEFSNNNRIYVRYSSPPRDGTPDGYSHTFVLSEFRTTEDYQEIIRDSEQPILEVPEPGRMHNSGSIKFGPDGYLYVSIGDGGGDGHDGSGPLNRGPDSHADDWYLNNIGGNGQDVTENLLGSILRIDVDNPTQEKQYSIPDDNPLAGQEGLGEHYAWGFRNPYSMSFDDSDLYVADVGTQNFEEINHVRKGGNYGWNVREGLACHNNFPPLRGLSAVDVDVETLPACPSTTPSGQPLEDPIITYPHGSLGVAIIGGHIYRGSSLPELTGKYVFGDLTGRLFAATPSSTNDFWTIEELSVTRPEQSEPRKQIGSGLLSIGEGVDGELYALTYGQSGAVQRIT